MVTWPAQGPGRGRPIVGPTAIASICVWPATHGVQRVRADPRLPAAGLIVCFDGQELIAATAASPHLRRAARRHGVRRLPPPASRLNNLPPSLATGRPGHPLRPVPWSGTGEVPEWLRRPPARPRLIVTHSTIAGAGGAAHLQPVLAAAAGLDAEVVLVRPPSNLTVPPAVRTTGWVPLAAVLPHATAVAHHGGAGTTLGALAAGIPQLAVPGSGDRRHNSAVVSGSGAGLAVPARGITRDVLHRLLHDRHLRANACELRDEIAAMPGPAEVSRTITALLSRGAA
ncbi:hypothetical protein CFP66_18330 [Pseudonocardia sp. MH-G8]|nr:hypothetical protein CFP66_18330 [Pseudonocardia sp. MH-G8]